jgi:sodium pump decarboxylase gamma subunit
MFPETMSIGAKLTNGLGLTILGMGVVFAILIALSFSLDALRVFLAGEVKKPPTSVKEKTKKVIGVKEDKEELVAVITAAIAANEEISPEMLVVKSIRQLPRKDPLWGSVGRQRLMQDQL